MRFWLIALSASLLITPPADATRHHYVKWLDDSAPRHQLAPADPQEQIITYCTPYDREEAEQKLLEAIAGARHKIRVCAYGFTDPALCDALINAQRRGVDVAVVMDSTQAAGNHQKPLVAKLRRNDIPVAIGKSARHSQLIHAKFIVIDDAIVESGSLNYSDSGLDQDNFVDFIVSDRRARMFSDFWDRINEHISSQR